MSKKEIGLLLLVGVGVGVFFFWKSKQNSGAASAAQSTNDGGPPDTSAANDATEGDLNSGDGSSG